MEAQRKLTREDQYEIAVALGENLALMHELSWPFPGRYNADTQSVQPFELLRELAWPFPVSRYADLAGRQSRMVHYGELVAERIRHNLARARTYNQSTTEADLQWVEELIARASAALQEPFRPCFVMQDYKPDNLALTRVNGKWQVSGVFDLMQPYFGDGESDLSRTTAMYIDKAPELAREFIRAYRNLKEPRPGFIERFVVYMLDDRAILWEYFQRTDQPWLRAEWMFRDWAERYLTFEPT
jgi:Ser/Thr protein kinase RdoA (MazF antagonist)